MGISNRPLPCVGRAGLFFSEIPRDEQAAVTLCGLCPEKNDCLKGARERQEEYGTWGGETRKKRLKLLQIEYTKEPRKPTVMPVTQQLKEQIYELAERGLKPTAISKKLGITRQQADGIVRRAREKEAKVRG